MSIFKHIFVDSPKMSEKRPKQYNDCEKHDSIINLDDVKFTVPDYEVTESDFPSVEDKHNSFNVVKKDDESGLMYRIQSDNSKEVFRLNCTIHEYKDNNLHHIIPDELKKAFTDKHPRYVPYIVNDDQWHFILRVFVTDKGRYFYQYIRANNSTAYKLVQKKQVQDTISICESGNSEKVFYTDSTKSIIWAPKPGTYTLKTYDTKGFRDCQLIDSYEIIDQKLYDEVIEVL